MTDTIENVASALSEFFPRLLGALVALAAAVYLARLVQRLLSELLERAGLEGLFERTGASQLLWRLGYGEGPSKLLGLVAFWGVIVTGCAAALSVLGLSSLEQTANEVISLSGRVLVALAILMAGAVSAGWLSDLVAREADRARLRGSNVMRRIIFGAVISVAALLAAGQLGLETSVLLLLAVIVLASIGLTTALALGPGLVPLSGNIAAGRYVQEDLSVGDEIRVEDVEGVIEELGHSSIILRAEDGYLYRVPNRTLLESIVRKQPRAERESSGQENSTQE